MREGPAMASAHELARGRERLRALIEFALGEGWRVVRTSGGHLKFTKPGCASIYTSSTASDHRADRTHRAQLRRAARQAQEKRRGCADAAGTGCDAAGHRLRAQRPRSEEHTSELQPLMP